MAQGKDVADASAEFGRLAADALQGSSVLPFHQLMTNPAAAMAAATAIGFGFSTQMAGAFWSAVNGAVEATSRFAAALEEPKVSPVSRMPAETDVAATVELAPVVKAKPRTTAAAKVAAPKAKAASAESPAPVLEKKVTRGRKAAAKTDDLKRISGVGPKLETVLTQRGVNSFADVASWSDVDVARIDTELGFEGRIARDDWVGQAKTLLASKGAGAK
jgi:NADH-quinone oxidoreductase subunit E